MVTQGFFNTFFDGLLSGVGSEIQGSKGNCNTVSSHPNSRLVMNSYAAL